MKRIRIYDTNKFASKDSLKLKRRNRVKGIILAAGMLFSSIFVAGCGRKHTQPVYSQSSSVQGYTQDSTSSTVFDDAVSYAYDSDKVSDDSVISNIELKLSKDDATLFNGYLSNINTVYEYDDFYGIDEALVKEASSYDKKSEKHTNSIELKNGLFDVDSLINVVKKNNKEYLNSDVISAYKKASLKDLDDSEIRVLSECIVEGLNYEIKNHPEIDMDELKCVVGDLKMFSSSSTSNAYVNLDNVLVISPNMINLVQIMDNSRDAKRDILLHESKHLIQKSCVDNENNEKETKIGISHEWNDLDVNPLKWNWFYEASAEKAMCNQTGNDVITYKYLVSYLDSITMATVLKDNVSADQTEYLCFQRDPEKLYEQFGCTNDKEKKELIKMMYTIDVLQYEREDFYDKYNPVYGEIETEDELVELQRKLKVSICETLTKKFYENLANYMVDNNMAMKDMFYVIRAFEVDINSHLDCASLEKADTNGPFMENYLKIQNNFFQYVADSSGLSQDEVISNYSSYVPNEDNKLLNGIDSSKKDFIVKRYKDVESKGDYSILEMNNMITSSNTKSK